MNKDKNQIDKMLQEIPLVTFSMYTEIQTKIVIDLGKEILSSLDQSISEGVVDAIGFNRAYGKFWLWVLGSYEIVRTMCQASSCFDKELIIKLKKFKKEVSLLRMPFAKQEYQGKSKPIKGEASVYGVDTETKDLEFKVGGTIISVRKLLSSFESIFAQIKREDILSDHRESPEYK